MCASNTGKGGLFFESLYENRTWDAEIRKHPATHDELRNVGMTEDDINDYDPFDLADESTLHLCGYNVGKKDNLSDTARQTIIAAAIESGAMSKVDVTPGQQQRKCASCWMA